MTHQEIMDGLIDAGFDTGWVISGEKIVLWLNDEPVPAELAEYLELPETE
jgi:hypothetical protein